MDGVGAGTCLSTDLVDAGGGEVLDQRRVGAARKASGPVSPASIEASDVAPRHFLVLVMDTAEQARVGARRLKAS